LNVHADDEVVRLSGEVQQGGLLASVFDNAPIGVAIAALDGRFVRVNRALCELLGYSEAELLELGLADVAHPDDRHAALHWGERLLDGEAGSLQLEQRYLHRSGREIWVQLSVSLIRDAAGAPQHFVWQAQDISERKRAELELLRERDHSAAIIAAMGEGYLLNVEGRIAVVNDALCLLTGFSREDLVGAGMPWPFWAPEAARRNTALRDAVLDLGGTRLEVLMRRKDGKRFDAEVTARAAHNPDGSVLGWVCTVRDISERRRYEAELERLATHDALTGLPNHGSFHRRLGEEVATSLRHGRPLSVVLIDLDRFKAINDEFGHLVGDRALEEAARRMAAVVRQGEMLARVGGEEFAWILPESGADGAVAAAERARTAVCATPLDPVGTLTISAGVAERGDLRDGSVLYQQADEALYRAKSLGRNRVERFVADPSAVA
jgi:diguanylate cyclase (GGDEF)-like protein/PAS domain S-box-containing protein